RSKQRIENFNLEEHSPPVVTMTDQHTMDQLLQAPTEGYEDAIVVPTISADNFELKHGLLTLVQNKQLEEYFRKENPPPEAPMADNRTMAELLQAPTEGYEDVIVIPEITTNNFELKHGLINLVQNKKFFGHGKEDPHAHIRYFNKITSTMRVPNVSSSSIKLMLFPFSLEGAARIWIEKEAPRSIQTWDDLVSKFINQFFPPSKTTNLRNEITRFQQSFDESFYEAWECFNDLLRACPHHGFSELHQIDTFYNALNINDQDSLNSAVGGNFLDKMPRECLKIIESKHKVRQSQAKEVIAKIGTSSSTPAISSDVAELKDMVKALLLDKKDQSPAPTLSTTPAPVKAVNQAPIYHAPIPQTQRVSQFDFKSYVKANDAILRNMQSQGQRTLPDNTITNPKEDLKGITTRSGVAYQGPKTPSQSKQGTKTDRALIDVNKGELTLRIRKEAITYNLDQTVRYSANYDQMTANKIDVICEIYSQEVLGFFDVTASGSPTPDDDPIISTTSPTLTSFGDGDFLLFDEADAFLGLEDDPDSPKINPFYYDPEGDILLLEAILNSEPLPPLPNHEQYLPSYKKELKGDNKLPVIIAKELGDEEKSALIKVLKSHKRAITWKLSDIQGINPEFCTHKILMEEDYKPAVQHQRRVNPKIHDVIKKEVEKLLDAGLIYPISDSSWVSPVHCDLKRVVSLWSRMGKMS
nr:reverse transcriptase domain-containing protein [Tanacetum cinerariifolium]